MGNRRLRHLQGCCKISDTDLRFKQNKQNPDTGRISKYLIKLRQIIKLFFFWKLFLYDPEQFFMNLRFFTVIHFQFFFFLHGSLHFLYSFFTFRARIALSTAIIITPTSAKIAAHIFAMPSAPRIRQTTLTPIAK